MLLSCCVRSCSEDMMEEQVVRSRRNISARTKGLCVALVVFCFGLVCVVQAVNIYLRIEISEVTEERDLMKLKLWTIDNYTASGWMYFKGSMYHRTSTQQSWQESRKYCQQRGADLIIINNVQEQQFATETFGGHKWIGLSDLEEEGVWRWVDGSLLNTSFWYNKEPNNQGDGNCVKLNINLIKIQIIKSRDLKLLCEELQIYRQKAADVFLFCFEEISVALVVFCFGLVCVVQAVNIYLRTVGVGSIVPEEKNCFEQKITDESDEMKITLRIMYNYTTSGWVYFKGSMYHSSNADQSWQESRKYCQQRGADLIIINNVQEQEFATNVFGQGVWIGLSDLEQEGVWRWVDGSLLNASFWYSGEPNGMHEDEDCSQLNCQFASKNWNDRDCGYGAKSLCERNIFNLDVDAFSAQVTPKPHRCGGFSFFG
ncbi:hypothetical protein WMY93_023290 [Mugilogobius chulae]|uniref:C-type lectin domain-containing protein n=1 Tax=Mugilogobius chulae TaxID=88201 RepID=A0AAW0N8B5_9GOBI